MSWFSGLLGSSQAPQDKRTSEHIHVLRLSRSSNNISWGFIIKSITTGSKFVIEVQTVHPGSPADQGGLLNNDRITAIDGNSTMLKDVGTVTAYVKHRQQVEVQVTRVGGLATTAKRRIKKVVTDVRVQRGNELEGPGFLTVKETVTGAKADVNNGYFGKETYFSFTQIDDSEVSPDTLVVEDVCVIEDKKDTVPPGYEVIKRTNTDHNGDLNAGSGGAKLFLCVKRKPFRAVKSYVTALCVMLPSKKEHVPPGFVQVPKDLNKGSMHGYSSFLCVKYEHLVTDVHNIGSSGSFGAAPPMEPGFQLLRVKPSVKLSRSAVILESRNERAPVSTTTLDLAEVQARFGYDFALEQKVLD